MIEGTEICLGTFSRLQGQFSVTVISQFITEQPVAFEVDQTSAELPGLTASDRRP